LLDGAIEIAEQRATARALDVLGIGDVTPGANRAEQPPRPASESASEGRTAPAVVDALRKASLRRTATPESVEPDQEIDEPEAEQPVEPEPEPVARNEQETVRSEVEPDMADYTWTHFWTWARANELTTKGQVEQRIGRPIDGLMPHDVRKLLHDTGIPL
jgi:hypothetical protein